MHSNLNFDRRRTSTLACAKVKILFRVFRPFRGSNSSTIQAATTTKCTNDTKTTRSVKRLGPTQLRAALLEDRREITAGRAVAVTVEKAVQRILESRSRHAQLLPLLR